MIGSHLCWPLKKPIAARTMAMTQFECVTKTMALTVIITLPMRNEMMRGW